MVFSHYLFFLVFFMPFLMGDELVKEKVSFEHRFVVYGQDNEPVIPVLKVSDHLSIELSEDKEIDLQDTFLKDVEKRLIDNIGQMFNVSKVVSYTTDEMINITVLGEISAPGIYQQPEGTSVLLLNKYNELYDAWRFDASITMIRDGNHKVIKAGSADNMVVASGDIFMLKLNRKDNKALEEITKENVKLTKKIVDEVIDVNDEVAVIEKKSAVEKNIKVDGEQQLDSHVNNELRTVNSNISNHKNGTRRVDGSAKKDVVDTLGYEQSEGTLTAARNDLPIESISGYILSPGDILTINLPGEEGFNKTFLINRTGEITLPEIGQVKVVGMTLGGAEKLIYNMLSDVYLGLDKLVVLIKERRLLVTVLGFVEQPGEIEISSNGNVQMAINKAGGLQDGAQLNKLQLRRGATTIEFNYKKYLNTGDLTIIPDLHSLDIVFVPSSPELGNVHGDEGSGSGVGVDPTEGQGAIKVFGEVIRPSSFPFIEGMSIVDALLRVGGVTRYANVEQISMLASGEPVVFDLKQYLDSGNDADLPKLPEGATLFIPKQVEAVKSGGRVVYVMGQVQKPGAFEIGETVGFMDVLANAGGPNRYADTTMIRVLKANGSVVRFNLEEYVEGKDVDIPKISGGDAIFVPDKGALVDYSWLRLSTNQSVQLMGAVNKPGRYPWAEGINFMDLLSQAGGPTAKADISHVRVVSTGAKGEAISREFNMQNFLERGGSWSSLPSLKGGVTIVFPELPEDPSDNKSQWIRLSSEQSIYIMGAVETPGRYAFNDQLDFLDILSAAQGPKSEADLTNIRIIHRNGPAPKVSRLNLVEYFESGDESLLPDVSTGDSIFIPSRNRSWVQKKKDETIRVLGSVKNSGRYEFTSEMTILDILAESGGPTSTAYIEKIIIVNSSCCKNQAYTFDLMDFMKDPDVSRLPVLRPGDTVYVPDVSNTQWAYFIDALKDTLSIISFISLTKSLIGGSAF